jgi:hypothetical protein
MWIVTGTGDSVTVRSAMVVARVNRGRGVWTRGVRPAVVGEEDEHALLFRGTRAGAGMALDHSLRRQEILDLLTELGDIIVFLCEKKKKKVRNGDTMCKHMRSIP